jgi:hypothetical protein
MGEKLLKQIIYSAICGLFQSLSAMESPDRPPESIVSAETPGPVPESVVPAEPDPQSDEDSETSSIMVEGKIIKGQLGIMFRALWGEDSEIPDALMSLFTGHLFEILYLELNEKMKCFATDQSIRFAIKNHDLSMLARILDHEIGGPIRKEIKANGMQNFEEAEKEHNVSKLENKCYASVGRFFQETQVLWIEYAVEMGNLEAIALLFFYHWHSTYSDNEEKDNKKLNEIADSDFHYGMPQIELFIRKLFDGACLEEVIVRGVRKELIKYPVYGRDATQATRRNKQFVMAMIAALTEDLVRPYIW